MPIKFTKVNLIEGVTVKKFGTKLLTWLYQNFSFVLILNNYLDLTK